uniref:alpha-2-macroglobulin family protein n=1 Tax=Promineifilum sp. TaxID=2664178 RepID=UPI0035B1CF6C
QTRRFAVEATVNDGSNLTVSGSAAVTAHRAAELVELQTESYFVDPGQSFPVTARVTTTVGEPTPVDGRALRAYLRHWSGSQGKYVEVEAPEEWITGPDGTVQRDYTLPGPGYYQFRLLGRDDAGRTLIADTYVYALGEDESAGWWYSGDQMGITISADREQYAPGDVARLAIASPFGGPALLTFERAVVRREMPVMLTPPLTVVEVPILPEDAPNIHVTVNAWEPLVVHPPTEKSEEGWYNYASASQRDAQLVTASVNLSVPVTDRTLTVTIATDRDVYAPRDEATVTVRVTDAAGQPVIAQVALAMVDEAIFLLADDNTRPLYDAFYHERPNRVRTRNALAPGRDLYGGGLGGGGGDGLGNPRSDFPDTAAWFPALLTDANGEATVTIALADSLTTWRLTARAVTAADTSVGEAIHKFTTHQDVIVRPILPRGLTVGDELALSAVVHNYGAEPAELTVSLSDAAGLLSIAEPEQTVALEPGQTRVIGWPVVVAAAGETRALVTATFPDGATGDAIELPLAARPLAVPIVAYASGDLVGSGAIAFDAPADFLPQSVVTLEISRSAAGTLLNGLEFLTGFPYGCVEQTMSRALPNAVVSRAFNTLGFPPPANVNLDELVNVSAQRLYGFQHDDGGWGWWFDDDSHDYQTAWVVFGLSTMAEAGHEIDPGVIERGAVYLREHLAEANPRTRAYMLYALAVAGQPDGPAALALLDEAGGLEGDEALDAFSLAALALALDAAGEAGTAGEIMDQLEATAIVEDGRAHWGITGGDGYYARKDMSSALRSTALALSAFVRLRPGSELEPQIVRYLMDARRGDGWGTTNETAYAILGLTDHLLATGVTETPAPYAVVLNGAPLAAGELAAGELRDTLAVPVNRLAAGENALEVTTTAGGRLYYTLNARYAAARDAIEADGPIVVDRRYLSPDGKTALASARAGELVLVRLTVKVPRDEFYMLVEDRVPGGLEPLNERLNATSHDAVRGPYEYWPPEETWRSYGYNYKEIREGRVTFFISELPIGTHTFEYTARATHTGAFTALPAEAWAMYEMEAWGRSSSDELVIEE